MRPELPHVSSSAASYPGRGAAVAVGSVLVVFVVIAWPLTRYFFAQDDFTLILAGRFHPITAITAFFTHNPGMFRPLGKGAWFVVMSRVAGDHAFAWHLASLGLHAFNVVWLFRVLITAGGEWGRHGRTAGGRIAGRRQTPDGQTPDGQIAGRGDPAGAPVRYAAAIGAGFFALHGAHFHAVAWVACAQQLLATGFALVAVERVLAAGRAARDACRGTGTYPAGVQDAHRRPGAACATVRHGVAVVAWALAAMCAEQAGPLAFFLAVLTMVGEGRDGARPAALYAFAGFAWLAVIALWRSPPAGGPYAVLFAGNVALNLWTYLGWAGAFALRMADRITVERWWFGLGHGVVAALVVWNLYRRRGVSTLLCSAFFLLAILAVLPLVEHQLYYHAYLPLVGISGLVAFAARDAISAAGRRGADQGRALAVVVLLAMAATSWTTYRANEAARFRDKPDYARSFVLRRATIAANAWQALAGGVGRSPAPPDTVSLVYTRAIPVGGLQGGVGAREGVNTLWNYANVVSALADGDAVRLFFGREDLVVRFAARPDDIPVPGPVAGETHAVFVFDDVGHLQRRQGLW